MSAQSYGFKALVSCWPLIKFSSSSAVISSYRRKLEHFLMAGCIVAVLFMLLRTRASLRHASYMTHRHRQLFFHLLVMCAHSASGDFRRPQSDNATRAAPFSCRWP